MKFRIPENWINLFISFHWSVYITISLALDKRLLQFQIKSTVFHNKQLKE